MAGNDGTMTVLAMDTATMLLSVAVVKIVGVFFARDLCGKIRRIFCANCLAGGEIRAIITIYSAVAFL